MNKFFDFLDKYKYGLFGAIAVYVFVFSYLTIGSYEHYYPITPFFEGPTLEVPEEIELQAENIDVANMNEPVKNVVRDRNDTRKQSDENWSQNKSSSKDVEQQVKDLEQQFKDESGGEAKRAQIQQKIDQLNKEREEAKKKKNNSKDKANNTGGDNAPKGRTMVDFELSGRTAHENNNWHIRNPGYTCPQGSAGQVVVRVKVDQSGSVSSVSVESSNGANSCMIEQALKYARISRFNYSGSAPKTQEGFIYYTFVSN